MKPSIALFCCLVVFATAETIMLKTVLPNSTERTYLCPLSEPNNTYYLFECPQSVNSTYELDQSSGVITLSQQYAHYTTTHDLNVQYTSHDHFPFLSFSTDRSNTFWWIDDEHQLNGHLNDGAVMRFYAAKGVGDGKELSKRLFAVGASVEDLEQYGIGPAVELQEVVIGVELV